MHNVYNAPSYHTCVHAKFVTIVLTNEEYEIVSTAILKNIYHNG